MDTPVPANLVTLVSTVVILRSSPVPVCTVKMVDSVWRLRVARSAAAQLVLPDPTVRASQTAACVKMVAPVYQMIPASSAAGVHLASVGRPVKRIDLPAHIWSANCGQETKYVTRNVRTQNVSGMEATVRYTGTSPGRTAQPRYPAGTYSIMATVTQNVTMQAASLTGLNATKVHRRAQPLANMTDTVQIIMPMVIVIRAATQKHVAGMVWTVPQILHPSWLMVHW